MDFIIRPPQEDTINEDVQEERTEFIAIGTRKLCPCGKMFTPYRSFQRYHSDACRVKYEKRRPSRYVKKPLVVKECLQCHKEFNTNDSKQAYCTHACYLLHEVERHVESVERTCIVCGEKFTTTHWMKRYCSKECRKAARWTQ